MKLLSIKDLIKHKPQRKYFVAIDSDGTVFDSMELKHKDCFVGSLIRVFKLALIAHEVHLVWNYVNIYSKSRGTNRFKALLLSFNYLKNMERVKKIEIDLPDISVLKTIINSEKNLTNESLLKIINKTDGNDNTILNMILDWSFEVDKAVKSTVISLSPMVGALKALKYLQKNADIAVISNTPLKTLHREWGENNIISKVLYIGGQETGSKTEMLKSVAQNKYKNDRILIIGDSQGDLKAAKNIDAKFFPIIPTKENQSWELFNNKYCNYFLNGEFSNIIEKQQIDKFKSVLDINPLWLKK